MELQRPVWPLQLTVCVHSYVCSSNNKNLETEIGVQPGNQKSKAATTLKKSYSTKAGRELSRLSLSSLFSFYILSSAEMKDL